MQEYMLSHPPRGDATKTVILENYQMSLNETVGVAVEGFSWDSASSTGLNSVPFAKWYHVTH